MVDHGGYNMYIFVRYPLAYLKYLNKYVLTANVSTNVKYVNTYACQYYLHKIVVLHISIYSRQSQICRAQLSYLNSFDMHMYWHIWHMQKHMHIYLNMLKDSWYICVHVISTVVCCELIYFNCSLSLLIPMQCEGTCLNAFSVTSLQLTHQNNKFCILL